MHAPIHDVQAARDGATSCTTADGSVCLIHKGMEPWQVYEEEGRAGWTRGLALCDAGLLVGMTAIRESDRDYYSMITRSEVPHADTRRVR